MKCHFPIADLDNLYSIAVLLCETQGNYVGLLLHAAQATASEYQDPTRKRYYTAYAFNRSTLGRPQSWRLAYIGDDLHNLKFRGQRLNAEWRDIYIHDRPPHWFDSSPALRLVSFRLDSVSGTPFRVPRWFLGRMQAAGFMPTFGSFNTTSEGQLQSTVIDFMNREECESVIICVGLCTAQEAAPPVHWATAWVLYEKTWLHPPRNYQHRCPEDHIDQWGSARTRDFINGEGDSERRIRVMLRPSPHSPETTVVVFVELIGKVYENIQRKTGVKLPSLKDMFSPDPDGTPATIPTILVSWGSPPPVETSSPADTDLAAKLEETLSLEEMATDGTAVPPHDQQDSAIAGS